MQNIFSASRQFRTLEGLRGVAAVAVVFLHFDGGVWGIIFDHSYLAVDLFFLISGFVIGHAYDARLRAGWSLGQFVATRLTRLAPLYFLGLLIGIGCAFMRLKLGENDDGSLVYDFMLGSALVPNLFGGASTFVYPLNWPAWTLLVEIIANLAYAASARRLTERKLKIAICLGSVALTLTVMLSGTADLGTSTTNWIGGFVRVGFSFPAGLLLHRLYVSGHLPVWRVPPAILVFAAIVTFIVPLSSTFYDLFVIAAVYPILVTAALSSEDGHTVMTQTFLFVGFISYPLYILHHPLLRLFKLVAPVHGLGGAALQLGFVGALVIFAYLIARFVDEPVRSWLRQRRPASRPGWADASLS